MNGDPYGKEPDPRQYKWHSFIRPVPGQKCIVDKYGIGRVVAFEDNFPTQWIEVRTYADGIQRQYSPRNVRLFEIPVAKRCA